MVKSAEQQHLDERPTTVEAAASKATAESNLHLPAEEAYKQHTQLQQTGKNKVNDLPTEIGNYISEHYVNQPIREFGTTVANAIIFLSG